jgi:hypothetical protein
MVWLWCAPFARNNKIMIILSIKGGYHGAHMVYAWCMHGVCMGYAGCPRILNTYIMLWCSYGVRHLLAIIK